MNPFDLRGPEFLAFYVGFGVAVLLVLVLVRRALEDGPVPDLRGVDPYLVAYLRGGAPEAIRVATLSLIDRRMLSAEDRRIAPRIEGAAAVVRRPLERAILESCDRPREATSLFDARSIASAASLLEAELRFLRLLPDGRQRGVRWLLGVAALLVLVGTALVKIDLALARGHHNIILLVLLATFSPIPVILVLARRRTRLGDRVLADLGELFSGLRARAADLQDGGATQEVALLLGVFGLEALAGDAYQQARALYPRAAAASAMAGASCGSVLAGSSCGSSSCGSSCGGGGCGGGCGGCGS